MGAPPLSHGRSGNTSDFVPLFLAVAKTPGAKILERIAQLKELDDYTCEGRGLVHDSRRTLCEVELMRKPLGAPHELVPKLTFLIITREHLRNVLRDVRKELESALFLGTAEHPEHAQAFIRAGGRRDRVVPVEHRDTGDPEGFIRWLFGRYVFRN